MKTKSTKPTKAANGEPLLTGGKSGQRSFLGRLAKEAFAYQLHLAAIDADEDETTWRHAQARQATKDLWPGGFVISDAPKSAFDHLHTHFLMLAGKKERAVATAFGPENDVRTVTHEIAVKARALGLGERYLAGICRNMFGGRETWSTAAEGRKVLAALDYAARRQKKSGSVASTEPLKSVSTRHASQDTITPPDASEGQEIPF